MKGMITVGALLVASGAAFGQQLSSTPYSTGVRTESTSGTYTTSRGGGSVVNFNVGGVGSWDLFGDTSNEVYQFDVAAALGLPSGTAVTMTGVSWDVGISTVGLSWLSEATIYFDDNIAPDGTGLHLSPGAAFGNPGSQAFSSGGVLDLTDAGIPDIFLPNGVLRLEFYEGYDDVDNAIDANWSGSIGIQAIPAPGALALLGLGGLVAGRRRR